MRRFALPLLLVLASIGGCSAQSSPWVEVKGHRFDVEIAADDAARARGLMFRDELGPGRGMLFIFEDEQPLAFWMKNTRIPLDIIYFDSNRRLVSIAAGVPPCTTPQCPGYPSRGPARFTLELDAGTAARLKFAPGDELLVDPSTRASYHLD